MSGFELSKWYADCITEQGAALILYSAELRWRRLPIHYTSLLTRYRGRPMRSRFSLRQQPPPLAQEGCVVWRSRTWNVEACWRERAERSARFFLPRPPGPSIGTVWRRGAPPSFASVRTSSTA